MTVVLDGTAIAEKIKERLKVKASNMNPRPGLAAVIVGEDQASKMYVSMKERACAEVGFNSFRKELPSATTEKQLLREIAELNADCLVHGILVQLPLPSHIDTKKVFHAISPGKDVDGFSPVNMGRLMAGDEGLVAATPKGIIMLLDEYGIEYEGKEVVIVNHSTVVGKPLAMLFLNRLASVTVCHVKTKNLRAHTRCADILVSATGIPHLIKADMVAKGAVVVDVGISKKGGKLTGDVDYDHVSKKASHITPVPGGVGPMTIAALLENTLYAAKTQHGL